MYNINWTEIIPLGQAIGWTIVHSLWQIALIAMTLRLLLLCIPQKRSNLRYSLSLAAMVLTTLWAGITFFNGWEQSKSLAINTSKSISEKEDSVFELNETAILKEASNKTKVIAATEGNHSTKKDTYLTPLDARNLLVHKVEQIGKLLNPFVPFIAIVWYLGVMLFSIFIITGFFHLNHLKTVGVHPPSQEWQERFEALKRQMGITKKVQFSLSEKIVEPITFYFFKPIVLAPIGLFTGLAADQIEVLLLHELAHIRRYDFTINIFQSLIEVLFFYHPVVWWMSREIRKEREHCCDDLVINIHNNPLLYAEALTCIQSPNFSLKTNLVMSATGKTGSFSKRIFRLFGQYEQQPTTLKGTFLVLLLLMGFFTQAFYVPSSNSTNKIESIDVEATTNSIKEITIPVTERKLNLPEGIAIKIPSKKTIEVSIIEKLGISEVVFKKEPVNLEILDWQTLPKTPLKKESDINTDENLISTKGALKYERITSDKPNLKKKEKVFIDWAIPQNRQHISAKTFQKWSAKKTRKLYQQNLIAHKQFAKTGHVSTEGKIGGQEEYEPLVYSINNGNSIRFDTLKTYVNHRRKLTAGFGKWNGKKVLKDLKKNIPFSGSLSPVKGKLPAIVKSTMVYSSEKTAHEKIDIGLELTKKAESVLIEIRTQEGDLVKTIVNKPLGKGEHDFIWYYGDIKSDTYQLDIEVNGQRMSQLRKIKIKKKRSITNACQDLLRAVKKNNVEIVAELLIDTDPDCTYSDDGEPRSPLVAAARKGNLKIVKLLLAANANVEYHAIGDESPLMAAAKNGHLVIVKLLIENRAKVNEKISLDGTALIVASREGHLAIVKYLIEQEADVNRRVKGDGTPLICAIRRGHYEVSKFLLENGADPKLDSPGDENPIYHANRYKSNRFLDLLMRY